MTSGHVAIVVLLTGMMLVPFAHAAPPPVGSAQDRETAVYGEKRTEFFQNFKTPEDRLCCGPADCRLTSVRSNPAVPGTGMEIWYGKDDFGPEGGTDTWIPVPPDALKATHPTNPFPRTIACVISTLQFYIASLPPHWFPLVLCVAPGSGM